MLRPVLLTLALGLLTFNAHAQSSGGKQPAWATWRGAGVSLAHPVEWTVDESGERGAAVIFLSPLDSGDLFSENVNLLVQDAPGVSLTEYATATEAQVGQQLAKGTMITSSATRDITGEMHQFEYTGELSGRAMHWKQVVRIREGKAYLLTFTAEEGSWDEMLFLAEAIMGSFKWLE